jgi:hypothetical protein
MNKAAKDRSEVTRSRGRSAVRRRHVIVATILTLAFASVFTSQVPSEYQVKAAFVLNFTKFVAWPSSAFDGPSAPLSICVLGEDPFGSDIDEVVEGEKVGGRPVTVERIRRTPVPRECRVLFISKSEKDIPMVLGSLGPAVLTVSDRDRFLQEGGMIAFVIENRRVRFDISQSAASRASLTMNALMLAVARSVQR